MNPPHRLRVEHLDEPLGLATAAPRFSWWVDSPDGSPQDAYELEVTDVDGRVVWRSGTVSASTSVLVPYEGDPLRSGTPYRWRVRVHGPSWSGWATGKFETSLLEPGDWQAPFLEPEQIPVIPDGPTRANGDWVYPADPAPVDERLHPAKYVRQRFVVSEDLLRARLYITAQGVYAAVINGLPVGDEVLAPGYESYDRSLSFQTYDVTELLRHGENVLGVTLADGWYAGRIAFTGNSAQYGDRLRLSWQLAIVDASGRTRTVLADGSARSTTDGPIRYADIFIGERYDARLEMPGWATPEYDDATWSPVRVTDERPELTPFDGEPIRRTAALPAHEVKITPRGDTVVDFGQVIAGRVRIRVQAPSGVEIRLEHSEVLDADGEFFDNIPLPNKDQTDVYVTGGSSTEETWEPAFTFHGFRYVRVTGYPGDLTADRMEAVVLGSDLEAIGDFTSSDPALTRLHRNAVWSQRANFLAVPTDCPQRERAGWTGDLQVFAPAATTNMAVASFLRRWLRNLRLDQYVDGTVPVIIPIPPAMAVWENTPDDPLMSIVAAAGWGDAVVIVPWVLYERYGDVGVLRDTYDAMTAWVERQARVAARDLPSRLHGAELTEHQAARQRLLWNSEPNFGDWLAPSMIAAATSLDDLLAYARDSGELIGAMYHGRSAELLARIAGVLGRADDERRWSEQARQVRAAFVGEYIAEDGRLLVESQGTLVLALAFGFVPDAQRAAAADRLVALIHAAGDHLDTGFLSIPLLLDVLWDHGHPEVARTLLWQRSAPSWLYEVDRGATTVWEQWDAIRPDGTVAPASFNHYAFGCVDDWLYRRLAGIQSTAPGYRALRIEPDFDAPLDAVAAHHDTPYGRVAVRWERTSLDEVALRIDVPVGVDAELVLAEDARSGHDAGPFTLPAGTTELVVTR